MKARLLWLVTLLIFIVPPAQGQSGPLLRTAYEPPRQSGSVRFYLEDIAQRTGVQFSYSDELVKRRRRIRLKGSEHTIEDILGTILSGTGVTPEERAGKVLLIPAELGKAQSDERYTISGFVK